MRLSKSDKAADNYDEHTLRCQQCREADWDNNLPGGLCLRGRRLWGVWYKLQHGTEFKEK